MRKILDLVARVSLYAALLLAPLSIAQPVAAHHCFGHVGTGPVSIAECADAGACLDTDGTNCASQGSAEATVNRTIRLVINIISFIVGILAVIMIIIGGLKYITSGGDSNNVASAKNTILYAIIGLVIVALAQVIVRFVLEKATDTASAPLLSLIG